MPQNSSTLRDALSSLSKRLCCDEEPDPPRMDESSWDIILLKLDVRLFVPDCDVFLLPILAVTCGGREVGPRDVVGLESWIIGVGWCLVGVPNDWELTGREEQIPDAPWFITELIVWPCMFDDGLPLGGNAGGTLIDSPTFFDWAGLLGDTGNDICWSSHRLLIERPLKLSRDEHSGCPSGVGVVVPLFNVRVSGGDVILLARLWSSLFTLFFRSPME